MVDLKSLGKLVKSTLLTIVSIEEENTANTQVLRVELANPIKATGSISLPNGAPMVHESNVVYVGQPNDQKEGAITDFLKGLPEDVSQILEDGGEVEYKGGLKLDVAKPKVNRNGDITVPAKLWLTQVRFANGANTLIQEGRRNTQNSIMKFFGQEVAAPAEKEAAPEKVAVTAGADNL